MATLELFSPLDTHNGYILVDFDGRIVSCTVEMAEDLELAYAVTVHKSQGSEFNAVVIPVLGGFDKLYFRNLLYTAVTRAKQLLLLLVPGTLAYMVQNNRKNTALYWFKVLAPKLCASAGLVFKDFIKWNTNSCSI